MAQLWEVAVEVGTRGASSELAATINACMHDDVLEVYKLPVAVRQAAMPSVVQLLTLALYHPAPSAQEMEPPSTPSGTPQPHSARGSWMRLQSVESDGESSDASAPELLLPAAVGGEGGGLRRAKQESALSAAQFEALHGALLSVHAAVSRAGAVSRGGADLRNLSFSPSQGASACLLQRQVVLAHAAALGHSVFSTCAASSTKAKVLLLHRSARLQHLQVEVAVDEVAALDEIQAAGGNTEEAGIHRFAHLSDSDGGDSAYYSDSSEFDFAEADGEGVQGGWSASGGGASTGGHSTPPPQLQGLNASVDDVLSPPVIAGTGRDVLGGVGGGAAPQSTTDSPTARSSQAQELAARLPTLGVGGGSGEPAPGSEGGAGGVHGAPDSGKQPLKPAPGAAADAPTGISQQPGPNSTKNRRESRVRRLRGRASQEGGLHQSTGGGFFSSTAGSMASRHRSLHQGDGSAMNKEYRKDQRLWRHYRASLAVARLRAQAEHAKGAEGGDSEHSASGRTRLPPLTHAKATTGALPGRWRLVGAAIGAGAGAAERGANPSSPAAAAAASGATTSAATATATATLGTAAFSSSAAASACDMPGALRGGGFAAQKGSVSDLALEQLGSITARRNAPDSPRRPQPPPLATPTPPPDGDDSDEETDPFSPSPAAISAAADTAMDIAGMSWLQDSSAERAAAGAAAAVVQAAGPVSAAAEATAALGTPLEQRQRLKSRARTRLDDEAAVARTGRMDGGTTAEAFPLLPHDPRELLPVLQAFMVFHVEQEEHAIAKRAAAQEASIAAFNSGARKVSSPVSSSGMHRRSQSPGSDIAPAVSSKTIDDTRTAGSGGWLGDLGGALERSASHIRLTTALGLGGPVFGGGPQIVSAMREEAHPVVPPPAQLVALEGGDTGTVTVHRTAIGPVVRHHEAPPADGVEGGGSDSDEDVDAEAATRATNRSVLLEMMTAKRSAGQAKLRTGALCCVSCWFLACGVCTASSCSTVNCFCRGVGIRMCWPCSVFQEEQISCSGAHSRAQHHIRSGCDAHYCCVLRSARV